MNWFEQDRSVSQRVKDDGHKYQYQALNYTKLHCNSDQLIFLSFDHWISSASIEQFTSNIEAIC